MNVLKQVASLLKTSGKSLYHQSSEFRIREFTPKTAGYSKDKTNKNKKKPQTMLHTSARTHMCAKYKGEHR